MFDLVEEAKKIIAINSVSQNGNEEIVFYLQELMKKIGFKTQIQEVPHSLEGISKRQFNLIGILGDPFVDPTVKKGLLLNTHLDTVPPGLLSNWTENNGDPFLAQIKDGKIYGLGSADVKLDFLCKLKACANLSKEFFKKPVYLVGTCGEEIGMIGAKFLAKSKIINPEYVCVGEPSELAVIYGQKAYCVMQFSFNYNLKKQDPKSFTTRMELRCIGKSAHGSYPHRGDNAIYKMLEAMDFISQSRIDFRISRFFGGETVNKVPDAAAIEFYLNSDGFEEFKKFYHDKFIKQPYAQDIHIEYGGIGESGVQFLPNSLIKAMRALNFKILNLYNDGEIFSLKDDSFSPDYSTFNLGLLKQTEHSIDLFYDFRILPDISVEKVNEKLKSIANDLCREFPDLIIKATQKRVNLGFNMKPGVHFVRTASLIQEKLGIKSGLKKKSTSTEASLFYNEGCDVIVFGPGKSEGNSHSPNEYNTIEQLELAISFYENLIKSFCL
jgi:acetylornithine deacetylase/succinyl-diaminopimelate desuccinylase-like protein